MPVRIVLVVILLLATLLSFSPVVAEEARYGQWLSGEDRLDKIIVDLDELIAEAERSRAAHPTFLLDLRQILDSYRTPQRSIYFFDDFADGDFSINPIWTMLSGDFEVDFFNSLSSKVAAQRPKAEPPAEESREDEGLKLFLGIVRELTREEGAARSTETTPAPAVIYSPVEIPNAFKLSFILRSDADWGSTAIGIYQGNEVKSGYHLLYHPSPSLERPLQLVRYRRGTAYVVGSAVDSPALEDGADHEVLWTRDSNGEMVISVDKQEILRSSDLSYRESFSGIAVINNGGSYSYDNIEIFTEN